MRRVTTLLGLVGLLVLAGCSGDGASEEGAGSSPTSASSSSAPESTTTTSATTTTTTVVDPGELTHFVPPTDTLSSFSFHLSMLNTDEEPFGIVSAGVFVAPDAVSCDAGNPAFLSPSLGVGTAIGSEFWFDDGLFPGEPSARSDEFAVEWLAACPGAAEYWASPIFLDDRFSADFVGEGEEIGGYTTYIYELSSVSSELELGEAKVWLTDELWPINLRIEGSVLGGVFTFFDPDDIEPDEDLANSMVPFEIELNITGVNGAQVVRAPDESVTVGPLNDPVVTVGEPPTVTSSLATAMTAASDTACYQEDSLSLIVTADELGSLQVSQIQQSSQDGDLNFNMITPGMAGGGIGTQVTSSAPSDVALRHAEILFNHRAPIFALTDWLGWVPPEMEQDGEAYISLVTPGEGESGESSVIASWNGRSITRSDGSVEERSYHDYLAFPDESLGLDAESDAEVQTILSEWTTDTWEAAAGLLEHDLQSATNLEYLYNNRDVIRQQACALLGTAWVRSDTTLTADQEDPTAVLLEEAAAQHLMLSLEYLDLLGGYLDEPEVDWLRAEGIDLDTGFLAGDTPGTIISFWTNMLLEALTLSDPAAWG